MIDAIVRNFLGEAGSQLLDLYQANSLWINGALLLYALVVFLGRASYKSLLREITSLLLADETVSYRKKSISSLEKMFTRTDLPWEKALAEINFPFLSPPGSLRPYIKNRANASKLISPEILAQHIHDQVSS